MKFNSRKDILFQCIMIGFSGALLLLVVLLFFENNRVNLSFILTQILLLSCAGFFIWIYFDTNYELNKTELKYKSGPIKGKINIEDIREIVKGKTLWIGLKPALARNGLIVKYEKYDEIYISPETNDLFVSKILELNNNIKITTN